MQTCLASEVSTDQTVVERARLGDADACDELVSRYRARALRIARSFVRDREMAEDVAQEAFVRAFLSIGRLRRPEKFVSYLTRTIVRISIDHSRKSSSSEVVVEIDPPPDGQPMPAEEAMYIRGILGQLSWKLRTVIVLRDVDGMDYVSIAKTLKLPVGTVRSRLSAARAAFKRLYLDGMKEASK